jgi:dTDP-4-dehydrorhamnose reductase
MKVLILGATGMLGNAVTQVFSDFTGRVICSSREIIAGLPKTIENRIFDADSSNLDDVAGDLAPGDFIINCIGIIKTEIVENSPESCARARRVNTDFPARLAEFAESNDLNVIQIATDCVFSGQAGHYSEKSAHDPQDVYGKTKSAGEILSKSMMHLRVSIIGPEKRGFTSLYDWVARQPQNAKIGGYVNHFWNGIPAKHFGKLARAIIENDLFQSGCHHLVPADEVTKAELVRLIADHAGRADIQVVDAHAATDIDRTLATQTPAFSANLWQAAGYSTPPTIARLVREI